MLEIVISTNEDGQEYAHVMTPVKEELLATNSTPELASSLYRVIDPEDNKPYYWINEYHVYGVNHTTSWLSVEEAQIYFDGANVRHTATI